MFHAAVADRFGRRLLIGGPALTSIGMFGSGFANSIESLLVWRFVAGAGSFLHGGALICLIDIAPQTVSKVRRHQSMGTERGSGIRSRRWA